MRNGCGTFSSGVSYPASFTKRYYIEFLVRIYENHVFLLCFEKGAKVYFFENQSCGNLRECTGSGRVYNSKNSVFLYQMLSEYPPAWWILYVTKSFAHSGYMTVL